MTRISSSAFSYRCDESVPAFDDSRPLFVFDGQCVLCSGGASRLMRADRKGVFAFSPAAGDLGSALYRHYGLAIDDSYLLLKDGHAYGLSEGYFQLCDTLGGAWHALKILRIVPRFIRDWACRRIARNRYCWFGRADACALLTPEQRARLL